MNSATRVKYIASHFSALPHDNPQIDGWKAFLNLPANTGADQVEESVIHALRALGTELRSIEAKAKSVGVPDDCYKHILAGISKSLSTKFLHLPWKNSHGGVSPPEVRMCLSWLSWALSQFSEEAIDENELIDLLGAISEQEKLLSSTQMPSGLRELLEGQLVELRAAIAMYQINGSKPIVDAVNKQCGEMRNASPDLVQEVANGSEEAKTALAKGMELISKSAKIAESGSKIFKFGKDVYELGSAGWRMFGQNVLTSTGN
ncbi:hypothetical protein [Delftia tsuruhatensis]|uniref:hypothetical protein n=1 Tax=Delftia tsuruhatensis TaxID=180282 RepID=UPI0028B23620|nr:hypothetical protein [Delftia tsuruhatensis]